MNSLATAPEMESGTRAVKGQDHEPGRIAGSDYDALTSEERDRAALNTDPQEWK